MSEDGGIMEERIDDPDVLRTEIAVTDDGGARTDTDGDEAVVFRPVEKRYGTYRHVHESEAGTTKLEMEQRFSGRGPNASEAARAAKRVHEEREDFPDLTSDGRGVLDMATDVGEDLGTFHVYDTDEGERSGTLLVDAEEAGLEVWTRVGRDGSVHELDPHTASNDVFDLGFDRALHGTTETDDVQSALPAAVEDAVADDADLYAPYDVYMAREEGPDGNGRHTARLLYGQFDEDDFDVVDGEVHVHVGARDQESARVADDAMVVWVGDEERMSGRIAAAAEADREGLVDGLRARLESDEESEGPDWTVRHVDEFETEEELLRAVDEHVFDGEREVVDEGESETRQGGDGSLFDRFRTRLASLRGETAGTEQEERSVPEQSQ